MLIKTDMMKRYQLINFMPSKYMLNRYYKMDRPPWVRGR